MDSFTRGILYTNCELKEIIKSVKYRREADNININVANVYDESFHVHGHRVGVRTNKNSQLSSLTKRSVVLVRKGKKILILIAPSSKGASILMLSLTQPTIKEATQIILLLMCYLSGMASN